jgi:hypothetical protein
VTPATGSNSQSRSRPRIALLNNYSMIDANRRVLAAEYPAQHLWGWWELRDTFEWIVPGLLSGHAWLDKVLLALMPIVGDLAQQLRVLRQRRYIDVIYAADQQSAALLCALRRWRLLKVPVIVMCHNGPRMAWTRYWMSGADRLMALSDAARSRVASLVHIEDSRVITMPWGPSLHSPVYAAAPQRVISADFVAAGKTNRDYSGLRRAAAEHALDGTIFGVDGTSTFRAGTETLVAETASYPQILAAIASARCVAVPLHDPERLSGLTEAADAMALGVPIVMSRSTMFPFDAAVTGAVFDATNADEIATAIAKADDGEASRAAALTYNMDCFGNALTAVVRSVLAETAAE